MGRTARRAAFTLLLLQLLDDCVTQPYLLSRNETVHVRLQPYYHSVHQSVIAQLCGDVGPDDCVMIELLGEAHDGPMRWQSFTGVSRDLRGEYRRFIDEDGWPDDWAFFTPFTGELGFEVRRRDDDRLAVWRPGRAEHAATVRVPAQWPRPGGQLRLYFKPAASGVPLTVRFSHGPELVESIPGLRGRQLP